MWRNNRQSEDDVQKSQRTLGYIFEDFAKMKCSLCFFFRCGRFFFVVGQDKYDYLQKGIFFSS